MGGTPYKLAKEGSGCSFKCFCISYVMQDFGKRFSAKCFVNVCMNTYCTELHKTICQYSREPLALLLDLHHRPIFGRLQYTKVEGEGLWDFVTWTVVWCTIRKATLLGCSALLWQVLMLFGHLPLYCGRLPLYCGCLPLCCSCSLLAIGQCSSVEFGGNTLIGSLDNCMYWASWPQVLSFTHHVLSHF